MRSHIRRVMAIAYCVAAIGAADSALAVVQTTGNVLLSPDFDVMDGPYTGLYADNPLTTTVNEGIPTNGNRIDPFRVIGSQIEYEGRPDVANNTNINFSVIVGRTSFGELIINQSQLRDMDLVIGDQGTASPFQRGTGVVRIEGFGSLYNNNPLLQPFVGDGTTNNADAPIKISAVERPVNPQGYDMYVGRLGNGTLQLALGGRAEIQDSVIAGDQSGSVGTIVIDGIDSFLQSGGLPLDNPPPNEVHYMVIGRLGSGTMSILNGGQSYNQATAQTGSGGQAVFGAVIGSNLAAQNTNAPGNGGNGTVYVDGIPSKWTVAGNLQIGGFHDAEDSVVTNESDIEGNDVIYGSGVGRGTLNVSNGALVSIVPPPLDPAQPNPPQSLDLLVGRFGRINMDGGRIELLGAFQNSNPQNPQQELEKGRLINDGIVAGDGDISVLQFRNRVLGEVRVGAAQSLRVEATGGYTETDNVPLPDEEEYPLSNYGVISVLGTETERAAINFDREKLTPAVVGSPADILNPPNRPFLNRKVPTTPPAAPNGRTEGLIHGEHATMRFGSGLSNRGVLAFTAGDNVVSGDVVSFADSAPGANDHGRVVIGPDTNVAFEDDFFTFGNTQISPGSTFQVLAGNSFAVGGNFSISVQGSSSGMSFDPFQITGNASFSGNLNVNFLNGSSIPTGSSVPIFNVGGSISGNFAQVTPSGLPFGSPIDFFTFPFGNQLYLAAFNVNAGVGPDVNGDGFVDSLDYAIWVQNFGTAGPAGDINGDGIVDAADYTDWQDACCGPFPGAGSGSGSILGGVGSGAAVPEPTSALLLACGSMLALVFGRRRSAYVVVQTCCPAI
jgi:hypothetical protein